VGNPQQCDSELLLKALLAAIITTKRMPGMHNAHNNAADANARRNHFNI